MDNNENKVINLPPKHTIYPKLVIEECEVDMEECLAKMRWGELKNSDENSNEANDDFMNILNDETKTVDFRNMRATEMPCNQRVKVVDPFESDIETRGRI